jgi:N-acetylglucosaminyldiphosphoundecaprenol N-acetyl-beta-D-mannosaminyltransferase
MTPEATERSELGVPTEEVVGYPVFAAGTHACVESILDCIRRGDQRRWLACINPHSYVVAEAAPAFSDALRDADWLIPDGIGLVLASRLRGGQIRKRVTGSDVFHRVLVRLNESGGARVYFLGSTEATLQAIRARMAQDYPRLFVVGTYSPPFKPSYSDAEIEAMVQSINATQPDLLWVGMTAPKQELWIHRVNGRLDVKFTAAIGAVFDFYAGTARRSHPIFQRLGLEWLPRLLRDPARLWKRMLVSAPIFLWRVIVGPPR